MWTIFSRDTSKDFPYEITECVNYEFNKKSLWNLNKGKKKVMDNILYLLKVYTTIFQIFILQLLGNLF